MSRLVLVLALGAAIAMLLIILFIPGEPERAQVAEVPEAEQLEGSLEFSRVTHTVLEPAEDQPMQTMVQIAGTVANRGQAAVTGATVELRFTDGQGGVVHVQTEPLRVIEDVEGRPAEVSLNDHPLEPGEESQFRIDVGPIPQEWDKQAPQIVPVEINIP